MKKFTPFIFCFCLAQENYTGEITFDYNGNVSGSFTSIIQDSIPVGFAFNQEGTDTSYFIMGAFTEQENNEFDLFLAVLQDTTFPVQPRKSGRSIKFGVDCDCYSRTGFSFCLRFNRNAY